jgi:hypothetical protein
MGGTQLPDAKVGHPCFLKAPLPYFWFLVTAF